MKPSVGVAAKVAAGAALAGVAAGVGALAFGGPSGASTPKAGGYKARPKGALNFAKDVAPVVFANCTSCHREGEVAPFTLASYDDVKKRARQIALVTERRVMPPWKAEKGYGEFHDERRLTDDQIGMLKQWADEGARPGDLKKAPAPPNFPKGWTLGKPDLVLEPTETFTLGAEGPDVYQCFVIPSGVEEDRWVSAIDVRPGNARVVHHVIAYLDNSGSARKLDAKTPEPGYKTGGGGPGFLPSGFLGGWAPGNLPRHLPDGIGMRLPKGADLVLEVHYHKSGKAETDRTRVGVHYSKKPVEKRLRVGMAINPFFNIPPGEANHAVRAMMPVSTDITVWQVMPHMHLLGRDMTVKAVLPDGGGEKPLVRVPDWDFNWQTTYSLKNPLKLPKGSRVDMVAHYDNSTSNPRNPSSPPRAVRWGEETTDEMNLAFVYYTVDSEELTKGVEGERTREFGTRGANGGTGGAVRRVLEKLRDK